MPDPIQSDPIRARAGAGPSRRVSSAGKPQLLLAVPAGRQAGRQGGRLAAHVCIHMYPYAPKQIYSRPDTYMVPAQVAKVDNLMWLSC